MTDQFFYNPPSSRIASCVGTIRTVTWHLHLWSIRQRSQLWISLILLKLLWTLINGTTLHLSCGIQWSIAPYCSGHKVLVERSQCLSAQTHRTLTRSPITFSIRFSFFYWQDWHWRQCCDFESPKSQKAKINHTPYETFHLKTWKAAIAIKITKIMYYPLPLT